MSRMTGFMQRLKYGLALLVKAMVLSVFVGIFAWLAMQVWHLWGNQQQSELVEVRLVNQTQHITEEALVDMLRPHLGINFWQLDLMHVRRLIETHPWVAHAEVSRFWPNMLRVEVVEQIPIARWGEDAFVNQLGDVFVPEQQLRLPDLIHLSSVNPEPLIVLARLKEIMALVNPYGLQVASLHRMADESWRIQLVQGDEWIVPEKDSMLLLKQLLALYGNIPKEAAHHLRIDLRYRDGFAVRWVADKALAADPSPIK